MHINSITADLGTAGTVDVNRIAALRYVSASGNVQDLRVTGRRGKRAVPERVEGGQPAITRKRKSPNMKLRGLLPVWIHTAEGKEPRDLFIFGIIGYHPDGDFTQLIQPERG